MKNTHVMTGTNRVLYILLQYKSVDRVLAERPTVVMMAHVNPLKDIVTAIRAAKLIVEEYKVTGTLPIRTLQPDSLFCSASLLHSADLMSALLYAVTYA